MILVLDLEDELDRSSGVCAPGLVVARIDNNSEEEEEGMSLNKKKGLSELLADRAKGSAPRTPWGYNLLFPFPLLLLQQLTHLL